MPLVVGVLAIIFAVIGIALTFLLAFGFGEELRLYGVTKEDLGGFGTLMNLAVIPSTVIFALHLAGGIFCVRFHRWAPNVITAYAVLALVVAGADIVLSALLFPGGMGSTMFGWSWSLPLVAASSHVDGRARRAGRLSLITGFNPVAYRKGWRRASRAGLGPCLEMFSSGAPSPPFAGKVRRARHPQSHRPRC